MMTHGSVLASVRIMRLSLTKMASSREGFIDSGMLLSVKISSHSLTFEMFCSFLRTKSEV